MGEKISPTFDNFNRGERGFEGQIGLGCYVTLQTAKTPGGEWIGGLKKIVAETRGAYRIFGDEEPLMEDLYDKNAYVYLVRVDFDKKGEQKTEYISVRLVKVDPNPDILLEDLLYYRTAAGLPILEAMVESERFGFTNTEDAMSKVGNLARLSAKRAPGEGRNWFTVLSYSLAQIQAIKDARNDGIEWFIHQLNSELQNRQLAVGGNVLDFVKAEDVLNTPVFIDKNIPAAWNIAINYPAYYFSHQSLKNIFEELVTSYKMPISALESAGVKSVENISEMSKRGITAVRGLFVLPDNELIKGSGLTGGEFREIIKDRAEMGPFLSLSEVGRWEETVNNMLEYLFFLYSNNTLEDLHEW